MSKLMSLIIYSNFYFWRKFSKKHMLSSSTYSLEFSFLFLFILMFLVTRVLLGKQIAIDTLYLSIAILYFFLLRKYFDNYVVTALKKNRTVEKYVRNKISIILFVWSHGLLIFTFLAVGLFGLYFLSK
jgi:hypothetical protein